MPLQCARLPLLAVSVRALALFLKVVLFLLLLVLAVRNSDPVEVRLLLDQSWQMPLALVILLSFTLGTLLGLLACGARLMRSHRELQALRKRLDQDRA